jgi:LuxR family maltose regulon positive regulatory protein
MNRSILQTKLNIPPLRPLIVQRIRLFKMLDQGLSQHYRLALVSALAGYGKTTLITHWLETQSHPAAWVSLDAADNDPIGFIIYLIKSLQNVKPEIGDLILETLGAGMDNSNNISSWIESILHSLINDLVQIDYPFILVIDDYHVIENQAVHDGITFLLDNLPSNAYIVISTRSDPPLHLANLRARGEIVEIRASDLRFTLPESTAFLNETIGLKLKSNELASLTNRTEGWIGGLQLAATSLKYQTNTLEFIENFTGSNRYIFDYLAEEVLRSESKERYSFLLTTSILDRFTGSLCDALTEQSNSQTMLEQLEQENSFVLPLDHERVWYRYHHLFADFLRHRLATEQPDKISDLHIRASQWYQQHDFIEDAIEHLITARAFEKAAGMIENEVMPMLQRGRQFTVERWIESIPESIRSQYPQLLLLYAWVLLFTGKVEQYEYPLKKAEHIWETDGRQDQFGKILAFRANVARLQRDPLLATDLAQKALDLLPEDAHLNRGISAMVLGDSYVQVGKVIQAREPLESVLNREQGAENQLLLLIAKNRLADSAILEGHLNLANEYYKDVLQSVGNRPIWQKVEALIGLGKINLEWNQLDEAETHLSQALALCNQTHREVYFTDGYVALAWLYYSHGNHDKATSTINHALQLSKQFEHQNTTRQVLAQQARIRLQQGDQEFAMLWLEKYGPDPDVYLQDYLYEVEFITAVRIWLSVGELTFAEKIIAAIKPQAIASGRQGTLIELLILESLVQLQQKKSDDAIETLKEALMLAEPSGYLRIFANESNPMVELLQQLSDRNFMPNYIVKLMNVCRLVDPSPFNGQQLIEPLTDREIDVLILMSEGASNQEIADNLTIAITTTKKHVSNILGKLGVKNRTEAVSRARELGLI